MRVYNSDGGQINTRRQLRSPYCAYGDPDRTPTNPCHEPNLPDGTYRVTMVAYLVGGGELNAERTVLVGDPPVLVTPASNEDQDPIQDEPTPPSPEVTPPPTSTPAPTATTIPTIQSNTEPAPSAELNRFGDWGYTSTADITSAVARVYNSSGSMITSRSQSFSPYCAFGDANRTPTNPCYEPSLPKGALNLAE